MTDLWLQYIDILIAFVQQIANQNLTFCTLGRAVYFFYLYSILYPLRPFLKHWFEFGINFTHSYLVTSNLQPNFLMAVTHSFFNIMGSGEKNAQVKILI